MIETGTNPGEQLDAYFDELYLHYGQGEAWKPFPGTQEALATLAKHYRTFVFSNFDERLLPILQAWKLDTHLSGILFSTALGASKPDPAAFSAALKAANADAACSLHVGDDPHADGEGAQQSGLAFFQISPPEVDLNTLLRFLGKHPD